MDIQFLVYIYTEKRMMYVCGTDFGGGGGAFFRVEKAFSLHILLEKA